MYATMMKIVINIKNSFCVIYATVKKIITMISKQIEKIIKATVWQQR